MPAPFPIPDALLYNVRSKTTRDICKIIAEEMERKAGISAKALNLKLSEIEKIGGSAIGDGVAVIGGRLANTILGTRICAFAKLEKPVLFKGIEAQHCDLVFVLLSPENAGQMHIRDLSTVIRTLRDHDFTSRLRSESAPEKILNLFRARDVALRTAA